MSTRTVISRTAWALGLLWLLLAGIVLYGAVTAMDPFEVGVVFLAWVGGVVTTLLVWRLWRDNQTDRIIRDARKILRDDFDPSYPDGS